MPGDKGGETPKGAGEYLSRPKAVKDTLDFYKKSGPTSAFRAAISRARDSLLRRGKQLPTNETNRRIRDAYGDLTQEEHERVRQEFGGAKPNESYMDADKRHDEAVNTVISERNSTDTQTGKSE